MFVRGNKQKAIDFIAENYPGKENTSKTIRDALQKRTGINYTVHNINLIRYEMRKGIAKPTLKQYTNTDNLLPPEDKKENLTPKELVNSIQDLTTKVVIEDNSKTPDDKFFIELDIVIVTAKNLGGIDRLIKFAQYVKKNQLSE